MPPPVDPRIIVKRIRENESPEPVAEPEGWRCFHCQEIFTDKSEARQHFGPHEGSKPACIIKIGSERGLVGALRNAENEAEKLLAMVHNESSDFAKAYHAQAARHNEQLRVVEENGYERGLADGRGLPAGSMIPAVRLTDTTGKPCAGLEALDRISGESPALQQGNITGVRLTSPDLGLTFDSREAGLTHLITVAREFVAEQDDRRPVSEWVYPGLKHALELIDRGPVSLERQEGQDAGESRSPRVDTVLENLSQAGMRGQEAFEILEQNAKTIEADLRAKQLTPDERLFLLDLLHHERTDIGYKVQNARAAGLGFAKVKAEEAGALLDQVILKLEP